MRGLIPKTIDRGLAIAYDTSCDQSDTESTWYGKDDGKSYLECDGPHRHITNCICFLDLQSGFSFAALSDISHADSDRTPTYRPTKARQTYEPRDWLVACEKAREGDRSAETLYEDATSEAPSSHWSSFSASTVRAGNWINPAPAPLRQAPTSPNG